VKAQTYPSGRTVSYSYNSAGQMSSFTGNLGGGSAVSYATGIGYNARGQLIREQFGTTQPLYQRKHYNQRGQLFDIRLGTDSNPILDSTNPADWQYANGGWNRGAIRLYYSASLNDYTGANPQQPDNNGNVHRMDHFVPTAVDGSQTITNWVLGADTYLYDELNRLTRITESYQNYSATSFKQSFLYDRYGNRTIDLANTDTIGGGVTRLDFKALTATNRLVAQTDTTGDDPGSDLMRYDKAGNLVWDNFSPSVSQRGAMTYDAENRMVTAASGTQRYRYDANGRRVKRLVGQTGTNGEVWQVYSPEGELLAEYPKQGAATVPTKEYGYRGGQMLVVFDSTLTGDDQLKWMVTDHLGSTRMIVNKSGSLAGIRRRDYLPFGEELAASVGHRAASGSGYQVDDKPRMKFTGHERDGETGLDFMQARYCSAVQGRFTSPDSFGGIGGDPQTLNLYAYVQGNPLRYADPTGHYSFSKTDPDDKRFDPVRNTNRDPMRLHYLGQQSGQSQQGVKVVDGKVVAGELDRMNVPAKRPGGFFSKIWGGVKKVGGATGRLAGGVVKHLLLESLFPSKVEAPEEGDPNDYISVYHGSIYDYHNILNNGLREDKLPTYVSTDRRAAEDAISPPRVDVQYPSPFKPPLDLGIVESRIPRAIFERLFTEPRSYPGFNGRFNPPTVEYLIRTEEQRLNFNRYIVR
jgi:RHS repeat-associated protein